MFVAERAECCYGLKHHPLRKNRQPVGNPKANGPHSFRKRGTKLRHSCYRDLFKTESKNTGTYLEKMVLRTERTHPIGGEGNVCDGDGGGNDCHKVCQHDSEAQRHEIAQPKQDEAPLQLHKQ